MKVSAWPLGDTVVPNENIFNLLDQLYSSEGILHAGDLAVSPDAGGLGVKIAPGGAIVLYDSANGGKRSVFNQQEEKSGFTEFPNGSFAVNLNNWIPVGGAVLTRDTGIFNSSPASMKIATSGASTFTQGARLLGGLLKASSGDVQEVSCRYRAPAGVNVKLRVTEEVGGLTNPGFETDLSGWTFSGGVTGTRDTVEKYAGAAGLKMVTNGAGSWQGAYLFPLIASKPGQVWKARVWAKGSGNVILIIHATDAPESTLLGNWENAPTALTGSWQEITLTSGVYPAGAVKTRLIFSTTATPQAVTYYADSFEVAAQGAQKEVTGAGTGAWNKLTIPSWALAPDTNQLYVEVLVQAGSAQNVYVDDFDVGGSFYWDQGFQVADLSNPRVDRVVVQVKDQDIAGGGDSTRGAKFSVIPGTPTSGATLVNLNGAAAIPANSLLLANVLVPAGANSLSAGNIDTTVRPQAAVRIDPSIQTNISALQAADTALQAADTALDNRLDVVENAFLGESFYTPIGPQASVPTLAGTGTLTKVTVPRIATVVSVGFIIATQAGNIDVAIYKYNANTTNFDRVWSRGSIACPAVTGGGSAININTGSPGSLVLQPGVYWLALVGDSSTYAYWGRNGAIPGISYDTTISVMPFPATIAFSNVSVANRTIHGTITAQ